MRRLVFVPRGRGKTILMVVVGLVVMALLFWFIGQNAGEYSKALVEVKGLSLGWIALLGLASLVNLAIYPFTEMVAIPGLSYKHAAVSRQGAFTISNIVPGGGAVAVATQYAILARYRIDAARAAAAVSADAVFTYLFTLGAPAIAVALLVIEGRSTTAYLTTAGIGLVIVIVSIIVIAIVLRSESGARRIGGLVQRLLAPLLRRLRRTPPDVTAALVTFHANASELVSTRWRALTVTNVGAQLAPILVLWVALAALGAWPGGPLTLIELFAAFSIALLLTAFPITPGGLGTVDAALVALLTAFGVSGSDAVAADLIWRLFWFLPQLLVGACALGVYAIDRRRDAHRDLV